MIITDIRVPVRVGQQGKLVEKLKPIQKQDSHTFSGTVARYVTKGNADFTSMQIWLIWKSTEMPSEARRKQDLALFQEELAEVLDWEAAQYSTNEAIIHT